MTSFVRSIFTLTLHSTLWIAPQYSLPQLHQTHKLVLECILTVLANHSLHNQHLGFESIFPVQDRCFGSPQDIQERMGCCYPTDVKVMHNVMLTRKRLTIFTNESLKEPIAIPPIKSLHSQRPQLFTLPVEIDTGAFPSSKCKSFFNGTLHVVGRSSALNVYHAGELVCSPILNFHVYLM